MGAQNSVAWLSPAALWWGIFAGPLAWAADLTISYGLVQWTCAHGGVAMLHTMTLFTLAVTASGGWTAWRAHQQIPEGRPTDGGGEIDRARFMAVLGLASTLLFAVSIVGLAVPRWVLDACH